MIRCMGCMAELEEGQTICPVCGYQKGTTVKETYYLLPEKILKQRYIVGKVLGYGGFGVTYLGWDAQLGRKIAIKEYLPSDFATRSYGDEKLTVFSGDATVQFQAGLESFLFEAKRLAKFNGIPEIVDIYDYFMENGTGYIIMEYLEGETVKEILAREEKIPFEEARRIMISVLDGLGQVHREGIIHRDIAPDNIFIQKDGQVRILDFGAARYATAIRSKSLSVILKPGYAPEEQYRSHGNQGPWTDIYAAGASFYRMITGVRPEESVERIVEDTLKPPGEFGIDIPKSVENAILNSLNVKAENRIQDAEVFCRVLKEQEEMERKEEEKSGGGSEKIPFWLRCMAGGAAALSAVLLVLLATGKITLTRKEIVNTANEELLKENEAYVSDLSGMSYEDGEKILSEQEIKIVIDGMNYSEQIEKNRILSQTPAGGSVLQKGETVYVVMSGGNQELMMPDFVGMKKKEAAKLVKAQGLFLEEGDITEEYNDMVEKGRIVSQNIPAREKIPVKTRVSLVVSLGSLSEETAELTVPDLVGMTNEEALACLKQLKKAEGFTYSLGEISHEFHSEVEKGRIISQSIPGGTKARTNEVISLVISDGPELVTVPDVVYSKKEDAVALLEAAGLRVEITTEYSSQVAEGRVISQSENADAQVEKGAVITLTVSAGRKPYTPPAEEPQEPQTPVPQAPETAPEGLTGVPGEGLTGVPGEGLTGVP